MSIRIPAGVRIDDIGVGGRFVSLDMLPVLADATDDTGRVLLLELAARELDRATDRRDRLESRFDDDPKRYAVPRADAEALQEFWQDFADRTANDVVKPTPEMVTTAGVTEDVYETDAIEWEFGVEYLASSGPTSNLDINVRIKRADGLPFGADEALDVMAALRTNLSRGLENPMPVGYRFAGIDWRSPNKGSRRWKHGTRRDLESMRQVLDTAADVSHWRLGSVE